MRAGKAYVPAVMVLGVAIAVAAFAAGCSVSSGSSPSASSSGGSPSGSAAERAQAILGHAPTGLAKTIVDRGSVIVANEADYPPQSSLDSKTGKPVGFDVDVAEQAGRILDLKVDFRPTVWETIPTGLRRGKYDVAICSMAVTYQSKETVDFADPYYYTMGQVFVAKGGTQIADRADLVGKKVGVGVATTYFPWLKKNTKAIVQTYTTEAEALQDLADGRLDFAMTAGQIGQQAIQSGQTLDFSGQPLFYEELAFATKQGEADWLALLDFSVQQMHKDGSLTTMSKKWYWGTDLTVK